MAINYSKVGWNTTKFVNPTNMNHMDDGIKAACDALDDSLSSTVITSGQNGGEISVLNQSGAPVIKLNHNGAHGGQILINNSVGNPAIFAFTSAGTGEPGFIRIYDGAHYSASESSRIQITSGYLDLQEAIPGGSVRRFYADKTGVNIYDESGTKIASYGARADFANLFQKFDMQTITANGIRNFAIPNSFRGLMMIQSARSYAALYSVVSTSSGGMIVVPMFNTETSVSVTTAANEINVSNGNSYNVYCTILGG